MFVKAFISYFTSFYYLNNHKIVETFRRLQERECALLIIIWLSICWKLGGGTVG
jgi:hypothetical protein